MKSFLWELLQTVFFALLIYMVMRTVTQTMWVDLTSMEPNFHPGQYLVINKIAYAWGEPQRGDVIILRYPRDPSREFIKRVIARPGETVEIKNGVTYVNGSPLEEPYIRYRPTRDYAAKTLGPNHYFVMGDNRPVSIDSRDFGELPRANIVGKAWVSLWPINSLGLVPSYSYAATK